jgi:hypothetical protein
MVERITAVFEGAGLLNTWQAGAALDLADGIDSSGGQTGSGRAALHRELRSLMADALRGVDDRGSRVGGMRDELAARRARREAGGA